KAFFSAEMREELHGYDALDDLRAHLPTDFSRWHPLSQGQYLETAHLLPGYILSAQGDRVAMAHSVEGRFPFLDHRLVEFASRIPPRLKIRGLREKHILREAMGDILPPSIGDRVKQPYRAPDSPAFVGPEAPDYVVGQLAPAAIAKAGFFAPRSVDKLVTKCRSGSFLGFRDNMAMVGILSTQLLHHSFAEDVAADIPATVAA
ncbi:MAG: asparagine synthase C-terminal domain-containing protein, partial [Bauldia litoralis]